MSIAKKENFGTNKAQCVMEWERQEDLKRKARLEKKLKEKNYKITLYRDKGNLIFYKTSELEPKEFYWSVRNKKRLEANNGSYLIEGYKIFIEDITDYDHHKIIKELIEKIK